MQFLSHYTDILKALHILAAMAWMAGMLYLPRLFVYHTQTLPGTDEYDRFCTMERKLLRGIINPAMVATFLFGGLLAYARGDFTSGMHWLHTKLVLVLLLAACHGMMAKYRKDFLRGENRHRERFYRLFNEIPAMLMAGIVFLAVLKPF